MSRFGHTPLPRYLRDAPTGIDETVQKYLDAAAREDHARNSVVSAKQRAVQAAASTPRVKTPPKPNKAKLARKRREEKAFKHAARRNADISAARRAEQLESDRKSLKQKAATP